MQKPKSLVKVIFLPALAIVVLLVLLAWMSGAFNEQLQPGQTQLDLVSFEQASPEVLEKRNMYVLSSTEIEVLEPVPASIEAKQNSTISSRILARIEKVHVRAGDQVKKGQLLIELEDLDLASRMSQASAQVKSVETRLKEAKQSLERAIELSRKGLLANAALESSQANYDSLQSDQVNAKQALIEAQNNLSFAYVRSPIDGLVIDRFAEPGNTAQPGTSLLSVYNPQTIRVEAYVRETRALSLYLGQALRVFIPSMKQWLDAEVEELVPAGNVASRSFLVKCSINQMQGLLPGMYARLSVSAGRESVLLIPKNLIREVGQLNVVWVFDDGSVARRFIRTGKQHDHGLIEVVSGLSEGETILPGPNSHPSTHNDS